MECVVASDLPFYVYLVIFLGNSNRIKRRVQIELTTICRRTRLPQWNCLRKHRRLILLN